MCVLCDRVRCFFRYHRQEMKYNLRSLLENVIIIYVERICNEMKRWIINKTMVIAFLNINILNICFSLARLNAANSCFRERAFHLTAWRIRIIHCPGKMCKVRLKKLSLYKYGSKAKVSLDTRRKNNWFFFAKTNFCRMSSIKAEKYGKEVGKLWN